MQYMHKIGKNRIIDSMLKLQNNMQKNMQPICNLIFKIYIICNRNQYAKYVKLCVKQYGNMTSNM
jgi:hypothetical protein